MWCPGVVSRPVRDSEPQFPHLYSGTVIPTLPGPGAQTPGSVNQLSMAWVGVIFWKPFQALGRPEGWSSAWRHCLGGERCSRPCAVPVLLLAEACGTVLLPPSSFTSISLNDCSHSVSLSPHNLFLTLVLGEGRTGAGCWFFLCLIYFCRPSSGESLVHSAHPAALLSHLSSPAPLIFLLAALCPRPSSPSLTAALS